MVQNLSVSYLNLESSMIGKRESMENDTQRNPYEQTPGSTQLPHVFATQVLALIRLIKDMGSPFEEESQNLLRLKGYHGQAVNSLSYYNTIKGPTAVQNNCGRVTSSQYQPIAATITRNKVLLFNGQTHKSQKAVTQVNLLLYLCKTMLHARQE